MGLFRKSLKSGFDKLGKNTGKTISNAVFGNKASTTDGQEIEDMQKQHKQEGAEKEESQSQNLEINHEETEATLEIERKAQQQKLEAEISEHLERTQNERAKMAIEIKKHNKNVIDELKKLKGLLDEELLTQEEYMFLKDRLLTYL